MVCLASTTALSEEAHLGVTGAVEYDTGAFQRDGKRVNAWSLRGGPEVRLQRRKGRFNYNARYNALYEGFPGRDVDGSWDHLMRLDGDWRVGSRTTLEFSDAFSRTENPVFLSGFADPDTPEVEDGRRRRTHNRAELSLNHRVTPLTSVVLRGAHALEELSAENRFDNQVLNGQVFVQHQLDPRNSLLVGTFYSYQVVQGNDVQPGSRTNQTQLLLGWTHQWSPSFSFNVRGGPSYVQTERRPLPEGAELSRTVPRFPAVVAQVPGGLQAFAVALERCGELDGVPVFELCTADDRVVSGPNGEPIDDTFIPGIADTVTIVRDVPPSGGSSRFSFFGEASLRKSWGRWEASLRYRRTEQPSSVAGSSTSVDELNAGVAWNPDRDWDVTLDGGWIRRVSTSESTVVTQLVRLKASPFQGRDIDGQLVTIAESSSLLTREVDSAFDLNQWFARLTIRRKLGDHSAASLNLRYNNQDEDGELNAIESQQRFLATLRFEFFLEPLRF